MMTMMMMTLILYKVQNVIFHHLSGQTVHRPHPYIGQDRLQVSYFIHSVYKIHPCIFLLFKKISKFIEIYVINVLEKLAVYSIQRKSVSFSLSLNLLNCLNGIIHLPFLVQSIIIFRYIKVCTWSWTANSIEPGHTARMCRLAWLHTSGKG